MRIAYLLIFAVAMTVAMTTSVMADAITVPDVASTSSMLGIGLVALAGLRAWMKK